MVMVAAVAPGRGDGGGSVVTGTNGGDARGDSVGSGDSSDGNGGDPAEATMMSEPEEAVEEPCGDSGVGGGDDWRAATIAVATMVMTAYQRRRHRRDGDHTCGVDNESLASEARASELVQHYQPRPADFDTVHRARANYHPPQIINHRK